MNLEQIVATQEADSLSKLMASLDVESDTEGLPELDVTDEDSSSDSDMSANATMRPKSSRPKRSAPPKPEIKKEKPEKKPSKNRDKQPTQNRKENREPEHQPKRKFESSKARIKTPKYDTCLPISAWIRNMEIYGRVTSLNDEELITCALSALLAEEQGSHIIASLTDTELQEWDAFKAKLEDVLGFSRDHWKYLFEKYQRGSDSFGVAMAKLTSYYRQGYNIKDLREHDEELLIEKFCSAQDDRLRELLLRDKASLNVSSIVKRANELERSIPKREINFAAVTRPESDPIHKQIKELMEEFKKFKADQDHQNRKSKPNGKKKSKIDLDKAQGYCLKYTNTGQCKFGNSCKYQHAPQQEVPSQVRDYAKSLL